MDLESLWYEAFPYLYGVGGVVALFLSAGSGLLKASGVLLIAASLTILRLRWVFRHRYYLEMPTATQVAAARVQDD